MKFSIKSHAKFFCHFLSFIVLTHLVTIFFCLTTTSVASQRDYWPTAEWKTSLPEEQGLDSEQIYSVADEIQTKFPDVYSILLVKNGRLVFEDYYSFGEQEKIAPVHSVTKSVMSILIGIAIDQGQLVSVDQKISEFFPEFFNRDINPLKKDISIRHLLTMTPGFEWADRGEVFWEWFYSSDFIKFTLDLELETPPGDKFTYSTAVSHILSGILTRATGMTAFEFGQKYLFNPLGIEDVKWTQGPKGFTRGGSSLQLKARDMAKIGFLYLNNGIWENKSIVSESWVNESTKFQVKADFGYGYGYQWWVKDVNDCPSYRAWGRGGQFIVVIPHLDLVMVITSKFDFPLLPTLHYSQLIEQIADGVKENKCRGNIESKTISDNIMGVDEDVHCKHLVDVPIGVSNFLEGYAKAFKNKDIEKSMTYYSDAFLLNGRDKDGSRKMLSSLYSQIPVNSICIQLSQFSQKGSIADVAGTLHLNSRATKLIVPKIILDKGHWKWYGDQRSETDSALNVPSEIINFLEQYCEAIMSHDKNKIAEYISDNFSSRGFTRDSFLSYIVPIYNDITSVDIELTSYEQKEGSISVDGLFKTEPFGVTPLMFNRIVLEDGKLKWAGTVSSHNL